MSILFIPVRTDNLKDFAKDLFLPATYFLTALKTNNIALNIPSILLTIPLDILLFTPRLIASPFRKLYQLYCPTNAPLADLIQSHPKFEKAMSEGLLVINVDFEQIKNERERIRVKGTTVVSLKALPGFEVVNQSKYKYTQTEFNDTDGTWEDKLSYDMGCMPQL